MTADPTVDEVLAVVQQACATVLEVDPRSVTAATRLVEDLQADSLAVVEIVEIVEGALASRGARGHVEDEDLDGLTTAGDVAHALAGPA